MVKIIQRIRNRFNRWNTGFETCPNSDDIEMTNDLAVKLYGNDDYDTISNVLKWQDKNIDYWYERSDLKNILIIISGLLLTIVLIPLILPKTIPDYTYYLLFILPKIVIILVPILAIYTILVLIMNTNIFLSFITLFAIIRLFISGKLDIISLLIVFLLGATIGCYCFMYFKYLHFLQKKTGETKYKEALKLLWLTFETRIPLEKILHYKMAMCIDYTKLTTAILINLGIEPYLLKIKSHAASAVKINNEFYVLDQQMPVEKYGEWRSKKNANNPYTYHVITSKNSVNEEIIRLEDADFNENEM